MELPPAVTLCIANAMQAEVVRVDLVQTLWGGYGKLLRCRLRGCTSPTVIVKYVRWPTEAAHPRGWDSNRSHERKVRSYQVETSWYQQYAKQCSAACRVPKCIAVGNVNDEVVILLEDLDVAGFGGRCIHATQTHMQTCLSWLAHFHATFLGQKPHRLWPTGTYWHLATRPDELAALADSPLKTHAAEIDRRLSATPFKTFVHGDAKLANFCFSRDNVAAVDFQYVGSGCGMKDVAYFVSSCLGEEDCERLEQELLNYYFDALEQAITTTRRDVNFAALERDWRALYPVAWTDFYRFLQGWSPGHWKIHQYSERLAREVLTTL